MLKKKNRIVLAALFVMFAVGCGYKRKSEIYQLEKKQLQEKGITENKICEEETSADTSVKKQHTASVPEANKDLGIESNFKTPKNSLLNEEGMTLKTRIAEPEGYERIAAKNKSIVEFLRNYTLKENGSPVLLFDGTLKSNQSDHVAVFKLPIENEDLQQCADSVMRVYAEYFWNTEQYERIGFHFVNGFYAEYTKWRAGYRIKIDGNQTVWTMTEDYDDSYENFVKYMRIVFSYAGTLSMNQESVEISLDEIQPGDVFLKGGSPGHVVMLVDICKNAEGKKAFLLAQGYMPAQEFHVLKNPMHEDDPWYYEEEVSFPFFTPEYTFEEGSLRRLRY